MTNTTISKRGCFKCGELNHIAENCPSPSRLCYNCHDPGHESNACPQPRSSGAKQCYGCGGKGHVQADCPTLRAQSNPGIGAKCFLCDQIGHFARKCPTGTSEPTRVFAMKGKFGGTAAVRCYNCGGLNHIAIHCIAPGSVANRSKNCYRCNAPGHIARDCPKETQAAS